MDEILDQIKSFLAEARPKKKLHRKLPNNKAPTSIRFQTRYSSSTHNGIDGEYKGDELYFGDVPAPIGSIVLLDGEYYMIVDFELIHTRKEFSYDLFTLIDKEGSVHKFSAKRRLVGVRGQPNTKQINLLVGKSCRYGLTKAARRVIMSAYKVEGIPPKGCDSTLKQEE